MYVYFGTFTNNQSEGIYRGIFEEGRLYSVTLFAKIKEPSYLLVENHKVYSIIQEEYSGYCEIDSNLTIKKHLFEDKTSCHISKDQNTIFLANYFSGETHKIDEGKILKKSYGNKSKAHYQDARTTILLGSDIVIIDGIQIEFPKGSGPRHIVWDQTRNVAYVNTELSNEIYVIKDYEIIFTIRTTTKKANTAAIAISKDNRFIYVSNRGIDSVSVFSIEQDSTLKKIEEVSTIFLHPRDIEISPCGKYLLVACTWGNRVVIMKRDEINGRLKYDSSSILPEVSCIVFDQ